MRWATVNPRKYLTPQPRLFVRNHTSTPVIDKSAWRLRVFGDGLATPRPATDPLTLSFRDLRRLPHTRVLSVHECTGNGRSFFASQQGTPAAGTAWTLGAVGSVVWEGVRLRDLLKEVGLGDDAVSIQATGLDPSYVSGGVDYGPVRRPFPVSKALRDAVLAWSANDEELLPDHGYPLRLVLPGWVGIGSIKWLGSLEVSNTQLTSPWNTKWYRMTGPTYSTTEPPLTVNPVRSAWELASGATLRAGRRHTLTGRAWSGAAPIKKVNVSLDGGQSWQRADLRDEDGRGAGVATVRGHGWTRFSVEWDRPAAGSYQLLARATDTDGRTQPLASPFNDQGYFFDAVVRHPVTVA
ncbi:molybdopterin-dependent oxidoreductase [Nocardioides anomalus]|uniref:Molybdopterin-dependent oxidoreductase n=1 Tax=Nocardioides anomalus TaxID=2712223 RepID=A0A6G6WBG4_9ACTN|nr:molybdopterin-dependent oxidoreductase [Nocardioides anomalus]QIG42445.1 molybdopterin-dependent oxidoreductase [Nocardioides anomalus]